MQTRVILGAPGCGKTYRLMQVLEAELKLVNPMQLAFVSFTRKGTYEGVERAKALYGLDEDDLPYFRTLHSIAFRAMKLSKYDMIDRRDYKAFSEAMGMKFTGYYTEEFFNNDDKYLFMHFLKRNNLKAAEAASASLDQRLLREVAHNFERYKVHAKVLDFTDIIERFVAKGEALPVKVAIIDEAQDLTSLQWSMCKVAFANCERLYVAGDDDQAIYEWSGADVEQFQQTEGEHEVLGESFRLRPRVLRLARAVTAQIAVREEKQFEPSSKLGAFEGEVLVHNSLEEVEIPPGESCYFLSRNNCFLAIARDLLRKRARVFIDKDGLSYDPKQVEAINAYERGRRVGKLNDKDEVKLKLHLKPGADLKAPWFESLNFANDIMAYYRDLIKAKTDLTDRSLTVSTIHGVKGGEADNVILALDVTRAVRESMNKRPDAELRCLYVAVTRAKKRVHLVFSNSKNGWDDEARRALWESETS